MRGRDLFIRWSPIISLTARATGILPTSARQLLLRLLRSAPGNAGMGIRYVLLRTLTKSIGQNVSIREGVYLLSPSNLSLGSNVSIHPMTYIDACGGIAIGNDVSIAHGATIMSSSHNFSIIDIPIKDQGVSLAQTTIADNCWIGAQSVLLGGVHLGHGAVVAANSVVTSDVPPESVVAGSPARTVRWRRGDVENDAL